MPAAARIWRSRSAAWALASSRSSWARLRRLVAWMGATRNRTVVRMARTMATNGHGVLLGVWVGLPGLRLGAMAGGGQPSSSSSSSSIPRRSATWVIWSRRRSRAETSTSMGMPWPSGPDISTLSPQWWAKPLDRNHRREGPSALANRMVRPVTSGRPRRSVPRPPGPPRRRRDAGWPRRRGTRLGPAPPRSHPGSPRISVGLRASPRWRLGRPGPRSPWPSRSGRWTWGRLRPRPRSPGSSRRGCGPRSCPGGLGGAWWDVRTASCGVGAAGPRGHPWRPSGPPGGHVPGSPGGSRRRGWSSVVGLRRGRMGRRGGRASGMGSRPGSGPRGSPWLSGIGRWGPGTCRNRS